MAIQISGFNNNVTLEVTSGDTCVYVKFLSGKTSAGYLDFQSANDAGNALGSLYAKSTEVSQDYRNRIGFDTQLDYECFNYTNQNVNKHFY